MCIYIYTIIDLLYNWLPCVTTGPVYIYTVWCYCLALLFRAPSRHHSALRANPPRETVAIQMMALYTAFARLPLSLSFSLPSLLVQSFSLACLLSRLKCNQLERPSVRQLYTHTHTQKTQQVNEDEQKRKGGNEREREFRDLHIYTKRVYTQGELETVQKDLVDS